MSVLPIYNPPIPFLGLLGPPLGAGHMVRIQGTGSPYMQRFAVNLQIGSSTNPRGDIALHLSVRPSENIIVRNTLTRGIWGPEERFGGCPIVPGQPFEILILAEQPCYKVAINGAHFCEFMHRMPLELSTHLTIDGDVTVSYINREGGNTGIGFGGIPTAPPSDVHGQMYAVPATGVPYGQPQVIPGSFSYGPTPPAAPYGAPQTYAPQQPYPPQGVPQYGQTGGYNAVQMSYPSQGGPGVPPGYQYQPSTANRSRSPVYYGDSPYRGGLGGAAMNTHFSPEKKKSSNKVLKYGLGIGGAGLGIYALSKAFGGSSSDSD